MGTTRIADAGDGARRRDPTTRREGGEADQLVSFILAGDGMFDRLNVLHVDDGTGDCATCGGPQSGRHRMPCTIRRALDRAAAVRR